MRCAGHPLPCRPATRTSRQTSAGTTASTPAFSAGGPGAVLPAARATSCPFRSGCGTVHAPCSMLRHATATPALLLPNTAPARPPTHTARPAAGAAASWAWTSAGLTAQRRAAPRPPASTFCMPWPAPNPSSLCPAGAPEAALARRRRRRCSSTCSSSSTVPPAWARARRRRAALQEGSPARTRVPLAACQRQHQQARSDPRRTARRQGRFWQRRATPAPAEHCCCRQPCTVL